MARVVNDPPGLERLSFRLPAARVRQLEALSRRNERSMSGELRLALERHLRAAVDDMSAPGGPIPDAPEAHPEMRLGSGRAA